MLSSARINGLRLFSIILRMCVVVALSPKIILVIQETIYEEFFLSYMTPRPVTLERYTGP